MVFFSCDGCGNMLKKNQVDSHAHRCRRCDSVSCLDCSVSFYGDEYRSHTSCISEAERYEKTAYRGNQTKNGKPKKRNPQEAWMDLIVTSASAAPDSIRHYMDQLGSLDNVPRKEKQFRNFTANSLKLRGNHASTIVDDMWKYLCKQREKQQKEAKEKVDQDVTEEVSKTSKTNADMTVHNENSEILKETTTAITENTLQQKQVADDPQFTPKMVKKTMKKLLKKAPQRSMKIKALRRAVGEKLGAEGKSLKKLRQLLKQQIGSNTDKIKVDGKVVSLR